VASATAASAAVSAGSAATRRRLQHGASLEPLIPRLPACSWQRAGGRGSSRPPPGATPGPVLVMEQQGRHGELGADTRVPAYQQESPRRDGRGAARAAEAPPAPAPCARPPASRSSRPSLPPPSDVTFFVLQADPVRGGDRRFPPWSCGLTRSQALTFAKVRRNLSQAAGAPPEQILLTVEGDATLLEDEWSGEGLIHDGWCAAHAAQGRGRGRRRRRAAGGLGRAAALAATPQPSSGSEGGASAAATASAAAGAGPAGRLRRLFDGVAAPTAAASAAGRGEGRDACCGAGALADRAELAAALLPTPEFAGLGARERPLAPPGLGGRRRRREAHLLGGLQRCAGGGGGGAGPRARAARPAADAWWGRPWQRGRGPRGVDARPPVYQRQGGHPGRRRSRTSRGGSSGSSNPSSAAPPQRSGRGSPARRRRGRHAPRDGHQGRRAGRGGRGCDPHPRGR